MRRARTRLISAGLLPRVVDRRMMAGHYALEDLLDLGRPHEAEDIARAIVGEFGRAMSQRSPG